jgi:hypothetical protein
VPVWTEITVIITVLISFIVFLYTSPVVPAEYEDVIHTALVIQLLVAVKTEGNIYNSII